MDSVIGGKDGKSTYSEQEKEQIRAAIHKKYVKVSASAEGLFKYQTGKAGAEKLGYDREILAEIPEDLLSSFCGVGNPFSPGEVIKGSDILDVGCGAGFDLVVARLKTGPEGRVCGVDLSPEMVERARTNLRELEMEDVETSVVGSEKLPFEEGSFDLVISNGVLNLSPAKVQLFSEIFRVLRPGGRLQIADIVLDGDAPAQMAGSLEAWAQ